MDFNAANGTNGLFDPFSSRSLFKIKFRAALFDLDGVLVDTAEYHFNVWATIAKNLGFKLPSESSRRLRGATREKSLEIVLAYSHQTLDDNTKQALIQQTRSAYLNFIESMNPSNLIPGTDAFLTKLKNAGIKIGLGSSSQNARRILEKTGILPFFDVVIDAKQVQHPKPDPQVFLLAAEKLCIPSEKCVVFEDASTGIQAAKSAGMFAVGLCPNGRLTDADFTFPGFSDPAFGPG